MTSKLLTCTSQKVNIICFLISVQNSLSVKHGQCTSQGLIRLLSVEFLIGGDWSWWGLVLVCTCILPCGQCGHSGAGLAFWS